MSSCTHTHIRHIVRHRLVRAHSREGSLGIVALPKTTRLHSEECTTSSAYTSCTARVRASDAVAVSRIVHFWSITSDCVPVHGGKRLWSSALHAGISWSQCSSEQIASIFTQLGADLLSAFQVLEGLLAITRHGGEGRGADECGAILVMDFFEAPGGLVELLVAWNFMPT